MHDLYYLLRQKEMDLERVRKEIAALRFVIPLLDKDADGIETGQGSQASASQSRHGGGGGVKSWAAERESFSI